MFHAAKGVSILMIILTVTAFSVVQVLGQTQPVEKNDWRNGDFEMIHDQLSLVKGVLSEEEIFLRLKQLSTTYGYYLSIGIGYSFGSSLSRAVNPRFSDFGYY